MSSELQRPPQEISALESRLMQMLHSVRLEKPAPAVSQGPPERQSGCPECGSKVHWGASSWCPDCGYYPKLGRTVSPAVLEAQAPQENLAFDIRSLGWLGFLSAGLVVILAESIASLFLIPDDADRALWGRVQLVLGIVIFAVGQFRAYLLAAQKTDAVPLSAFFFEPFELWKIVCLRLPDSRKILYLGAWGGLAAVLAFGVIGLDFEGMFSGFKKVRKGPNMLRGIVKAAAATEGSAFSSPSEEEAAGEEGADDAGGRLGGGSPAEGSDMEASMKSLAGATGADSIGGGSGTNGRGNGQPGDFRGALTADANAAPSASKKPEAETIQKKAPTKIPRTASGEERLEQRDFVVFGYLINPAGEIRSVLLADMEGNRGRFVGRFSIDTLSTDDCAHLQEILDQHRTQQAMLSTPYRARWVVPVVTCRIAFTGRTPEGQLKDAFLMGYGGPELSESSHSRIIETGMVR